MLGTIEPRKNHELVFGAIKRKPELLETTRLVLAGREGWGPSLNSLLDRYGLRQYLGNRILHVGFCTDAVRDALLRNARALIYPSFYEGFGLPVLEAISAGTATISSFSSSLPEAGGDAAFYVDPTSVESLLEAIDLLESTLADAAARERLERRMMAWSSRFSWDAFCSPMLARIDTGLQARTRGAGNSGDAIG